MEGHSSFGVVVRPKRTKSRAQTDLDDLNLEELPPTHRAAADGNANGISELVRRDPSSLERHSSDGLTPLAQAVQCQKLESVKRLIKLGANIDAQDNVGRTCLSVACYQGWHQGVMCLLRNGAKQSICDKSGRFPLHAATYHSDMSTMSLLLNGLTSKEVNQSDHELMTAVHWAAFHDRPEHLLILVQKGGDILARDVDGKLPLHWAAQNNSFQCAHRLISLTDGEKTVNDLDLSGKSPAHYAAAAGAANILKILAQCEQCDLEVEDPEERTPLHWAAAMGQAGTVETLLELGVNPFPMDVEGGTPLEYALQNGSKECIKVMEEHIGTSEVQHRKNSIQNPDKKEKKKEHRYHYNKRLSDSKTHDVVVPEIEIQPPTTQTTSNRTVKTVPDMVPRMYSASTTSTTDTDAYDFQGVTSTRHVKCDEKYESKNNARYGDREPDAGIYTISSKTSLKKSHESAVSRLIGSSFMTGAGVTVLNQNQKPSRIPMETFKESGPTECGGGEPNQEDANKWANPTNQEAPSSGLSGRQLSGLKIKTSTNTPELQRISVQSFRSIPPISNTKDGVTSPRDPERHVRREATLDDD